ncbi:MAG: hypothetical protein AAB265_08675, partial [candidate division NC10 bacterium]
MAIAAGLCIAAVLAAGLAGGTEAPRQILVTVGEVIDTGAVLWVRAPEPGPIAFRYGPMDGPPTGRGRVEAA